MDILLEVGFIKDIQYPWWLPNVVVVPKKNDKWRVYVDYTNLNDACSKDTFCKTREILISGKMAKL